MVLTYFYMTNSLSEVYAAELGAECHDMFEGSHFAD